MKAIFSLCTKFVDEHNPYFGFPDAESFYCSCLLSVLLARQQFGHLAFYTDSHGAELIERLHLPFDEVHLASDRIAYPRYLWMTSKLQAYYCQAEPFVHLDLDAYLWAPFPPRLQGSGIIAQSSEEDYRAYDRVWAYFLKHAGYMPDFVREHAAKYGSKVRALNAGIYGGHDLATIQACCEAAFDTIAHPANRAMFAELAAHHGHDGGVFWDSNILLEQCFASLYCHKHGLQVDYVLSEREAPYFTHLLSSAKRHPVNVRNLKSRVAQDYPDYYRLAQKLAA